MKDTSHRHLGPLEYGTIRYILILEKYVSLLIGLNNKTDDICTFFKRDFRFWSELELINFQLLGKAKWCVYWINKDNNINNPTHTHTQIFIYIYIYIIYIYNIYIYIHIYNIYIYVCVYICIYIYIYIYIYVCVYISRFMVHYLTII